jgi:hypothetical protein
MKRHRFDPFSLLFGAFFVAVGMSFLLGSTIMQARHSLWPVLAIAVGCTFVAWAIATVVRERAPVSSTNMQPTPEPANELDDPAER